MVAYICGVVAVAFFLLYFAFKLENNHFLLQLLLVFFSLYSLILIPQTIVNDNCEFMVANETVIANTTSYSYEKVCDTDVSYTKSAFMKIPLWFFRLFVTYIAIYIFWHWAKKSEKFCRALDNIKRAFGSKKNG